MTDRLTREQIEGLVEGATPGPWQRNGSHIYGPDPDRLLICQAMDYPARSDNLIAAAPTLAATALALMDERDSERDAAARRVKSLSEQVQTIADHHDEVAAKLKASEAENERLREALSQTDQYQDFIHLWGTSALTGGRPS